VNAPAWKIAKRGLRFTREGRVFVLTTIGVGAASVNTGNNMLYLVLGLMLSLIVLSGVLSDLVLYRLVLQRSLPTRAFVGRPSVIEITVMNEKQWFPSFSIEVEDRSSTEKAERPCYFFRIGPRSEQILAYRRTPLRRGPLSLSGFRVSTRYPFGLFEKWRQIDHEGTLLVYPALVPMAAPDMRGISERDEMRAAPRPGHGTEVVGLREYREGDDARAVHGRRSAALGRLVVRERERDSGSRLTIVIDERRPEGTGEKWEAEFEDVISRAAFLVERALAEGASVDVMTRMGASPRVQSGASPDPIFRFLACVSAVAASDAPPLPTTRSRSVVLAVGTTIEERTREAS
jgi:uncharacterized protein (DUF58 family)